MPSDGKKRTSSRKQKSVVPVTLLFRNIPSELALSREAKRSLRFFAISLSKKIGDERDFVVLLTDDPALQELNYSFLGHNYPTDVLSFPSGSANEMGEVAISVERAAEQARQFEHSCLDELRILMLHGALHLIGMDHETDNGEMALAEREWRSRFSLPLGLVERTVAESRP